MMTKLLEGENEDIRKPEKNDVNINDRQQLKLERVKPSNTHQKLYTVIVIAK